MSALDKQLIDLKDGSYHLHCHTCFFVTDAGPIKKFKHKDISCGKCNKDSFSIFATLSVEKQLDRILSRRDYISQIKKK
jgi:hypothetical protein